MIYFIPLKSNPVEKCGIEKNRILRDSGEAHSIECRRCKDLSETLRQKDRDIINL
jgi:hypothetical protein